MKNLLCFALVLNSFYCTAQNYQCLKSGPANIFINGNGYIRGMRVDSVRAIGSDTVYYPYHTPRGAYYSCTGYPAPPLDSAGSSWLGKNVIQQPDGTFLFDNLWDTVVIRSQAITGDSWVLYSDTTQISYKATVTATDTMNVLGTIDSVKKITIEADSAGAVNTNDPVNNFEIILSKHSGFVKVFDLYTFPYHRPDTIRTNTQYFDYYMDLVLGNLGTWDVTCYNPYPVLPDTNNSVFHLISFQNPTIMEIYDFAVGDVYEFNDYHNNAGSGYVSETILDTVISSTITPYYITSSSKEHTSTTSLIVTGITYTTTVTNSFDTAYGGGDTTKLLYLGRLPEEWKSGLFYHYASHAPVLDSCMTSIYTIDNDNINYESRSVIFQSTDFNLAIGYSNTSYGIGYGRTGISSYNYSFGTGETGQYVYIDKSGSSCGTFSPLANAVKNINTVAGNIQVYPNPTHDLLTISASGAISDVTICNMLGEVIMNQVCNSQKVQANVAGLPTGMYLIKINGTEVKKFMKE